MIVILDYGIGNLGSILNMIRRAGADALISSSERDLEDAAIVILPGVGAFDNAMLKLKERGLISPLNNAVRKNGVPLLGICLGMQLLFGSSEEGDQKGLGWIDGSVVKFDVSKSTDRKIKLPHMGWNRITYRGNSYLSNAQSRDERYYFVHSYHAQCADSGDILATCQHGYEFTCAVAKGNIFGVQFHPEKSHKFGISFFERFFKAVRC